VKKLDEYLKHADECHDMARTAQPSHRAQLEDMARTWDKLAEARRRQLEKDGKTEEYDTEGTGERGQAS
jgi:hypothetical protein